jgi:hypothetical protein
MANSLIVRYLVFFPQAHEKTLRIDFFLIHRNKFQLNRLTFGIKNCRCCGQLRLNFASDLNLLVIQFLSSTLQLSSTFVFSVGIIE